MDRKITIIQSARLKEMKLSGLAGRAGTIAEDLSFSERKVKGYMIHLKEPFLNEYLWFVPKESISYEE